METGFGNAHAQIAIFGYVKTVPTLELLDIFNAKMVGGAAQRNWRANGLQTRQNQIEPQAVLGCKQAGQKVLGGIVKIEFGLNANRIGRGFLESQHRAAQLLGFWLV